MDKPSAEIMKMAEDLIRGGADVYIKWTCPSCGERCVSNDKNVFHRGGYLHESCGFTYTGDLFGLLVIWERK